MSDLEIRAPADGTEGTRSQLSRWLKAVGDEVAINEPLIEIETDKVTVEIASPGSGVLCEILKQEQEEIVPGEILGRLRALGADPSAPESAASGAGSSTPEAAASAASAGSASDSPGKSADQRAPSSDESSLVRPTATRLASPAVHRLLAERGLTPSQVVGTGEEGRITVQDVLAAARETPESPPKSVAHTAQSMPAEAASETGAASPGSRLVPHSPVRRRIAQHMVESLLLTAPHVTTVFDCDLTRVLSHRERHRQEFAARGAPLTLTVYFLQAAVSAIRAVPEANSRWTPSALELYEPIHIGVGTALDTGLVVPVLRDVHSRDLSALAQGLDELVQRARAGTLSPADMRGGTFTISNHGVSGSLFAAPIVIHQPQSAILGVGKVERRPSVHRAENGEERIVVQPRCYVTLTIDHRVMDGHRANRFLQTFVHCLEAYGDG